MTFPHNSRQPRSNANKLSPLTILRQLRVVVPAALLVTYSAVGFAAPATPISVPGQQTPRVAIDVKEKAASQSQLANEPMSFPAIEDLMHEQHEEVANTQVTNATTATATTLSYPYGIGLDPSGNIYVTNLFGGVNIYNENNYSLKTKFSAGMYYPAAVSIAYDGTVYVANYGGNNITVYNPGLTQTGTIGDSTLVSPLSMFVDSDGDIWALDAGGTTHLYLNNGTAIGSTHTGGTAIGPWGSNVTVWGITNPNGGYDEKFENMGFGVHSGPYLGAVFTDGSPDTGGVAQDTFGQQYVTDILHSTVQIWSTSGTIEVGIINLPAAGYGVAVDSTHGRIYVVEDTLNQVQVFSTKAPYALITTIK